MEGTSVVRMREFSSPKGFCSRAARRRGESSGRRRASSHFGPMKEKVAASYAPMPHRSLRTIASRVWCSELRPDSALRILVEGMWS